MPGYPVLTQVGLFTWGQVSAWATLPLGGSNHSHPVPVRGHGECHLELPQRTSPSSTQGIKPWLTMGWGQLTGLSNKCGVSHSERPLTQASIGNCQSCLLLTPGGLVTPVFSCPLQVNLIRRRRENQQ